MGDIAVKDDDMPKKYWQCCSCNAIITATSLCDSKSLSPKNFINASTGEQAGCAFCGSKDFRVVWEQLPPE